MEMKEQADLISPEYNYNKLVISGSFVGDIPELLLINYTRW